jgi:DNA invertase Pin-like site-specific DNA recombinase
VPSAIIYTRISQDRKREGAGVKRQETDARRLAKVRGWKVSDVIEENDTSAAGRKARPGFERLLAAVEDGSAQVVIAWNLDRLTRNRRDTVRLIEVCEKHRATISLVRGSDMDMSTPSGRQMADFLAAIARGEIETKSDRQSRAALQAAEQGRWIGGRRPFGYESDGVTVREPEAQAVRDAYQWLLDGVSLRQIAGRWNHAELWPPQGRRDGGGPSAWIGTTVSRCLKKARYAGLRSHKGEIIGDAKWDALVDLETWHAAQAIMNNPDRRPGHGDQKLLTGVALCGICNGPVHAGGGAPGRGVYRCAKTQGHVIRKRQPVDDYITDIMIARLSKPNAYILFTPRSKGPSNAELLQQADGIRRRLDGLAEAYADGAVTASQLRKGTERLKAALIDVEGRLGSPDGIAKTGRAIATAPDVRAAWEALDMESRRMIINALVIIHLDPPGRGSWKFRAETVRVAWKTG